MAWNKEKPADTEKIRIGPSVIRDNWEAIEENDTADADSSLNQWVVHLIDRATIGGANTPDAIADIGMVYCRNDGAVNELYFEDPVANEIQLTEDGKLGSDTTQIVTQDISFGSETATYDSNNMVAYWAAVDLDGTILAQSGGLTCTRDGAQTGKFIVTFTVAQSDANYGVLLSVENDPGNSHTANYHTKTVNNFKLTMVNQNATKLDNPFTVTIYGKRP